MRATTLLVSELFGPTFQGEGPSAGQRALFVRLSRCNLTCDWCDTPSTWDTTRFDLRAESRRMSVDQLLEWLERRSANLVVITGGEPLLQQEALLSVVDACVDIGRRVEVETNGTVAPLPPLATSVTRFNVSPKLANSGITRGRRICPEALGALGGTGKAVFKFVVREASELKEVAELERAFALAPIWVMPEGARTTEILPRMRALADEVLARGWNLSSRLHVLLWEDARGR